MGINVNELSDEQLIEEIKGFNSRLNALFEIAAQRHIQLETNIAGNKQMGNTVITLHIELKSAYKQLVKPSIFIP